MTAFIMANVYDKMTGRRSQHIEPGAPRVIPHIAEQLQDEYLLGSFKHTDLLLIKPAAWPYITRRVDAAFATKMIRCFVLMWMRPVSRSASSCAHFLRFSTLAVVQDEPPLGFERDIDTRYDLRGLMAYSLHCDFEIMQYCCQMALLLGNVDAEPDNLLQTRHARTLLFDYWKESIEAWVPFAIPDVFYANPGQVFMFRRRDISVDWQGFYQIRLALRLFDAETKKVRCLKEAAVIDDYWEIRKPKEEPEDEEM